MTESLSEVIFANARGTVEEDVFISFDEGAITEISDKPGVKLRVKREIEALQRLFLLEESPRQTDVKVLDSRRSISS
jgi:hypothetical protein